MIAPLSVSSTIGGIAWPGIPASSGASLLAILFQLEQSQWWSPPEISRKQRDQLKVLLDHARAHVPFYRERLRDLGGLPADESWHQVWRRITPLTRAEIQAADATGDDHGDAAARPWRVARNLYVGLDRQADPLDPHSALGADVERFHGSRPSLAPARSWRRFATLRESGPGKAFYPDGLRAESWGSSSATILKTGPLVSLNVATPIEQQVEWLQRHNPDYLLTHPTIVHRLADHCREQGVQLPHLKQVITIAENLKPEVRSAVREAWGVPVVDIYSTREIGYIALQCPDHEHYHTQSEHVLAEVLNEAGQPCAPGEVGKLFVTSLHNLAKPLIRYDIGDHVEVGRPCPCGRGLPVIQRILGRTQNMLVMPTGERRWPLLSSTNIATMLEIAPQISQYQFLQKSPDLIELRLAVPHPLATDEETRLAEWVRTKLGAPFRVSFAYFDEVPRTEAGKFEDFICEIDR